MRSERHGPERSTEPRPGAPGGPMRDPDGTHVRRNGRPEVAGGPARRLPTTAALPLPHRAYRSGALGAGALGTGAIGALALGSLAVGAVAIGAFAIGRLSVRRARIGEAEIGRLRIDRLEVGTIVPAAARRRHG
ncbi:hypothetical protein ACSSVZ_003417 [Amorphus sp. MBR-141]